MIVALQHHRRIYARHVSKVIEHMYFVKVRQKTLVLFDGTFQRSIVSIQACSGTGW